MNAALEIMGLTKSYGELSVLKGVELRVAAGELVTVLGESGGGKTTLLRLIAGFEQPDGGTIAVAGKVLSDSAHTLPPERRRVGIVPQEAALFPHLSAADNIGFGLNRLPAAQRAARVRELLDLVDLTEAADRLPHQLSGGQQQRVALARALAPRPELVLLDEPFAALDLGLRGRLRDEVRSALQRAGATAVLVTHDQDEALSISDRVAVLREGRIAQFGTPQAVYSEPVDVSLAQFLGDAVVLPAFVEQGRAVTIVGALQLVGEYTDGLRGEVAIRPENFYLQPDLNGAATVVGRQYFGHDAIVTVRVGGKLVQARAAGPLAPELGMRVTVWVRGGVNFYPTL